ncbi:MAG TPA: TIGR03118 family protein [Steroidobacteraceae bacterium]|nr:TIGR03118 family protein [Steroidobacteraceae bacterium]
MKPIVPLKRCRAGALTALSMLCCVAASNAQVDNLNANGFYRAHALVSNGAVPADVTDAKLVNPWGLAFNPNAVVWVSDNGTGVSTLYDGAGAKQSLVVAIPPAAIGDGLGHPTGIVFNSSTDFVVKKGGVSGAGVFLFAGEDGTISGWAPSVDLTRAVRMVDRSAAGAVYKGLALGGNGKTHLLYAADFHNRRVDVFNANFARIMRPGAFQDSAVPANFAPFGIQNINGDIVVAYAKQDSDAHDDVAGPGLGIVDVFDANGTLIRRLATRGALNAPWGVALAPSGFGRFGGALLVGNFGDGAINAFDPVSGKFLGSLSDGAGKKLHLDGLWGIAFGNGVAGQATDALYYTAGPNDEADGVYGVIRAVAHP